MSAAETAKADPAGVVTLADYSAGARKGWDWERRFWAKVEKTGTCWLWTGGKTGEGYGQMTIGHKRRLAHRLSYLLQHTSIPVGLHIDHLCRVRNCVNPAHLEAVTSRENFLRGISPLAAWARSAVCAAGLHPFDQANTHVFPNGNRACKKCRAKAERTRKRRRRAAVMGLAPETLVHRVRPVAPIQPGLCQCGCGFPVPNSARTDRSRGVVKGQPLHYLHGHATVRYDEDDLEATS